MARSNAILWAGLALVLMLAVAPIKLAYATEVKSVKSPLGMTAWLVEDHTNPVISMSFAFKGAAALDPVGKAGLANLVSALLDEGAGDLDSQAFQRRLEDGAITLRFSAGKDNFSGNFRTLTENMDEATELLRLAVTSARFDVEPVERIRAQVMANVRRELEDADTIASDALFAQLFPSHGYGRRTDGTLETIGAIERKDLVAFANQRLVRSRLTIGISGDITEGEAQKFIENAFGDLPMGEVEPPVAEVQAQASGMLSVIKRDFPQSAILFGHGGIKRDDPDFYAALIMNHILGGGSFTSRLYEEVREKRGLVYSIGTGLAAFDHAGAIIGSAGTANARAAETIAIIRQQWGHMAEGGATDAELADAKTYVIGSFPLRFTSSRAIARILVSMQLNHLGADYLDKRKDIINAVNADDVRRVAARLLDSDRLNMVVVGQPQGVTEGVVGQP